jgi:GNAT superfamily N-acetyltransferase
VGAAHPHETENHDMAFALRHRDDSIPFTPEPLPGLEIRIEEDPARMAALQGRTREEMERRFAAGHRSYLAVLDGEPAAWGWVATRAAEIGEIGATFPIPAGERYLWNFVTLKPHRGKGIYPRLIQGILRVESREAERFWIGYAPENHASGAGIRKAGFTVMAEVSFDDAGRPAVKAIAPGGDAAVARLLGLPVADEVAACWRCVRAGKHPATACAEGECCCDYQRLEVECAA